MFTFTPKRGRLPETTPYVVPVGRVPAVPKILEYFARIRTLGFGFASRRFRFGFGSAPLSPAPEKAIRGPAKCYLERNHGCVWGPSGEDNIWDGFSQASP